MWALNDFKKSDYLESIIKNVGYPTISFPLQSCFEKFAFGIYIVHSDLIMNYHCVPLCEVGYFISALIKPNS